MPSIDTLVTQWQKSVAPMQMGVPTFGPMHTLAGISEYGVANNNVKLAGHGPPAVVSDPPFDWQHAPDLVLRDMNNIYWWGMGNPYAIENGASGYFPAVDDTTDPSHPLSPAGGPIGAELYSNSAPYAFPTEAQLHLVDPAALADFFKHGDPDGGMVRTSSTLADVVGGAFTDSDDGCSYIKGAKASPDVALPPSLSLLAPASASQPYGVLQHSDQLNPYGPPTTNPNLTYDDFYSADHPETEVRAVKLQAPGICTNEILLDHLLHGGGNINKGLFDILSDSITGLCDPNRPVISGAALSYLFGIPVIDRDADTMTAQHGFFLNLDLSLQATIAGMIGLGCSMHASALYDVVVEDGHIRFTVRRENPDNIRIDAYNSHGCDDIIMPTWLFAFLADLTGAPAIGALLGPLGSGAGFAALAYLMSQGGLMLGVRGPNTIVRDVLLAGFIRQLLNQVVRSQISLPIGDFGNYLYQMLGSPSLLSAGQLNAHLDGSCDPTLPTSDEFVEDGNGDVPGDRHVTRTSGGNAISVMCRLVREGFMQTHSPNGPPLTLTNWVKGTFTDESAHNIDPCNTIVRDLSLWSNFNSAYPALASASIPSLPNTDEFALDMLLQSLLETEDNGKTLRNWRCPTPCDPSENDNMAMDLMIRTGIGQLRLDNWLPAAYDNKKCNKGCKSTLSSILGGKDKASGSAPTAFGRFLGCSDANADPPAPNDSPADPTSGLITFYPPVRRLIVNPDGLQAVFVDNENDWTNAALAFRYALAALDALSGMGQPAPTSYTNLSQLVTNLPRFATSPPTGLVGQFCNYRRPTTSTGLMRKWATLRWPPGATDQPLKCGKPNRACDPPAYDEPLLGDSPPLHPQKPSGCQPPGGGCYYGSACCSGMCSPHTYEAGSCLCYDLNTDCSFDAQCCSQHCLTQATYVGPSGSTVVRKCGYPPLPPQAIAPQTSLLRW